MIPNKRNIFNRLSASPLPSGFVFRLADGLECPYEDCRAKLRCDPEPGADGETFRQLCQACHRIIMSLD
jgi:hypothetical protein